MYNQEEAKQIRLEFWNKFTVISEIRRRKLGRSRHWILHHTGVSPINLKFDINETEKWVSVGFEVKSKKYRRPAVLLLQASIAKTLYRKGFRPRNALGRHVWN